MKPKLRDWGGKVRESIEGFGLCSPTGRRPVDGHARYPFAAKPMEVELKRMKLWWPEAIKTVTFLEAGKEIHRPSEDESSLLRKDGFQLLPDTEAAAKVPGLQPLFLLALSQTARCQGDPDWEIPDSVKDSFAKGVPIGLQERRPRAPSASRRQINPIKVDESELEVDLGNHSSSEKVGATLKQGFVDDSKLGMMHETTRAQAKKEFKGRLRMAALGASEKSDVSCRIPFDATRGV
ncbi:unnamed protein product [Polarella glacialis]|uniref:Uncharacterized protein n=1 Tax=Polarella glacialis TaxID=89957 RepID=A0A813KZJ6_POLGL|nr:unnamed protein product [Polarella glacialis]